MSGYLLSNSACTVCRFNCLIFFCINLFLVSSEFCGENRESMKNIAFLLGCQKELKLIIKQGQACSGDSMHL